MQPAILIYDTYTDILEIKQTGDAIHQNGKTLKIVSLFHDTTNRQVVYICIDMTFKPDLETK